MKSTRRGDRARASTRPNATREGKGDKRRSPPPAERGRSRRFGAKPRPSPFTSRLTRPPVSDQTVEAIVARQRWDLVETILSSRGFEPSSVMGPLRRFVTMVVTWNGNVSNLISKNDVSRIAERHLIESLEPAAHLARLGLDRWMDFGSGAGFPAIPLALVGVGRHWQLVESRRPKTLFLRKTVAEIELREFEVVHDRLENVVLAKPVDGFTARATEAVGPTLRLATRHVRPDGVACLWKGSSWKSEMDDDGSWGDHWRFDRRIVFEGRQSSVLLFIKK